MNNTVNTALRLLRYCQLLSSYDFFSVDCQDFLVLVSLFHWKEETSQHTGVCYIKDRTLHCYCCFSLLTQIGKQPTLALSIEVHRLQPDPDSPAHTGVSDKGFHRAAGDGVKTYMIKQALGELVPAAVEMISRVFS